MTMLDFALDRLISLIGPIVTLSKDKRELKDNALRSISTALRETRLYYRDRQGGKPRNLEVEAQLAKCWAEAAIPIRHIDEDLAILCEHKADFWTGPEEWNGAKIERVGIKLEDVTRAYREIAMPKFSTAGRVGVTNKKHSARIEPTVDLNKIPEVKK